MEPEAGGKRPIGGKGPSVLKTSAFTIFSQISHEVQTKASKQHILLAAADWN